jgi:hypothetical protein
MAAGLGFKDFVTGEVLTAADVDGYLMQGVWVFASAAARDAAVTSPQEGNFAYLKDTNVTTYYTGSAWANLDTTGMTNPMTTTGDTIYSSSGSTPARLGIGSTGQVLTVSGGVPAWGDVSAGGMTLISTTTFSGTSVTLSSIPQTYNSLYLVITGVTYASGSNNFRLKPNDVTNLADYNYLRDGTAAATTNTLINLSGQDNMSQTDANNVWTMTWDNYTSTTRYKTFNFIGSFLTSAAARRNVFAGGTFESNTALTSLVFDVEGTISFSTGTVLLYGVK